MPTALTCGNSRTPTAAYVGVAVRSYVSARLGLFSVQGDVGPGSIRVYNCVRPGQAERELFITKKNHVWLRTAPLEAVYADVRLELATVYSCAQLGRFPGLGTERCVGGLWRCLQCFHFLFRCWSGPASVPLPPLTSALSCPCPGLGSGSYRVAKGAGLLPNETQRPC